MKTSKKYKYFVEGEMEKKLIDEIKQDKILPGVVTVFNVTNKVLTKMALISIKTKTTVILVFDTDAKGEDKVLANIEILKKNKECERHIYNTSS